MTEQTIWHCDNCETTLNGKSEVVELGKGAEWCDANGGHSVDFVWHLRNAGDSED